MSAKTVVIIPAFNEAANIGRVIDGINNLKLGLDIVIIDDGSSDDTVAIAREHGAKAICLPFNFGYGVALQTGYKYALKHGYDYIIQMDADGQHDTQSIKTLLGEIQKNEVNLVIGSRFLSNNGKGTYKVPFLRYLGIKLFRHIASFFTKHHITDPTSGFQALDKNVVKFYAMDIYPGDYPDADVLIMLYRTGFKFKEVPVMMHENLQHKSMHSGLTPVYYLFKMFLSIIVTLLRRETRE